MLLSRRPSSITVYSLAKSHRLYRRVLAPMSLCALHWLTIVVLDRSTPTEGEGYTGQVETRQKRTDSRRCRSDSVWLTNTLRPTATLHGTNTNGVSRRNGSGQLGGSWSDRFANRSLEDLTGTRLYSNYVPCSLDARRSFLFNNIVVGTTRFYPLDAPLQPILRNPSLSFRLYRKWVSG